MKKGSNRAKTVRIHEMELRKHRLKVKDQHKELCELSRENLELRQSLETLGQVHTAYMISLAMKYGDKTESGGLCLIIPRIDVQELVNGYTVSAGRTEDGDTVIHLEKK